MAFVIWSVSGEASSQVARRVELGAGVSATLRVMRDIDELVPPCIEGVYDFGIDDGTDPQWAMENRALWDETEVVDAVESTLRLAYESLPGPVPDICLAIAARPDDSLLRWMEGVGGATLASDLVVLFVAPILSAQWLDTLRFVVAHEYHHAVRQQAVSTGLDVLIREGKAHHFASTLYPTSLHPSARALEPAEISPAWETIRGQLSAAPNEFLSRYMFGGPSNGNLVAGWAGYTIGYCLVWAYAERNPGLTAIELARVPPRSFVLDGAVCPKFTVWQPTFQSHPDG